MMSVKQKYKGLSGNALKLFAAVSMVIDHFGFFFYPNVSFFRVLGRFAMPIFAYMIFVGCRYTKNKAKYFLTIAVLGLLMNIVQYYASGILYGNILITFSFSIAIILLINHAAEMKKPLSLIFALLIMAVAYYICNCVEIDYGFGGIMLPVFASAFYWLKPKLNDRPEYAKPQFYGFAIGLVILALALGREQPYSLLALIPLAMYNGKRGFHLPKYSFYIFYPAHVAVLWLISQM